MTRAIAQVAQAAVYRHFHPAFSPSCGKDIPARETWEGGMAVPGNRKYFTLNLVYAVSVIETPSRITRAARDTRRGP